MHNKEVGKLEEELPLHEFEGAAIGYSFLCAVSVEWITSIFMMIRLHFYLKNSAKPIIFESNAKNTQCYLFGYACFSNKCTD